MKRFLLIHFLQLAGVTALMLAALFVLGPLALGALIGMHVFAMNFLRESWRMFLEIWR